MLLPKDYVIAALCSVPVADPISSIGLVDAEGRYLSGVLDLVDGSPDLVAPLLDFDTMAGRTTGALGFPPGIPVAAGTMDAWGNVYGSGVVRPGQAMEVAGTSEIIGVLSDKSIPTKGVVTFPPVRNRVLHAGPTQAGGDALVWFARMTGTTIDRVLADVGSSQRKRPILFLPHLDGERAPVWNPDAQGVFLGIRSDTELADMALAVLEGVAFSSRLLLEACETAAGVDVEDLRLSGGAARSPLWNQIKASVHGRSISVMRQLDSGALGAALMAGIAAGLATDLETWAEDFVEIGRTVEPASAERNRYEHLYGMYRETYDSLVGVFARLDQRGSDDG
jgi:xylulokinase